MRYSLLILALLCAKITTAQWQILPPQINEQLYDISFSGGNTILAGTQTSVIFSSDNGSNWNSYQFRDNFNFPYANNVSGVHLIDEQSAVVSGTFYLGNSQAFLYSNGGFLSWSEQYINNLGEWPREILAFSFPTPDIGYAVGHSFSVLKSTDGGVTWAVSTNVAPKLNGISMLDSEHGIAVGIHATLLTSNGGATWTTLTHNYYMDAVAMATDQVVYAGGDEFFLKSIDGGHTWQKPNVPFGKVNGLTAVGVDTIFACTNSGLYFSASGGSFWEVFPETKGRNIQKLVRNGTEWWAIGGQGFMMRCQNLPAAAPIADFTIDFPFTCGSGPATVSNVSNPSGATFEWFLNDSLVSTVTPPFVFQVTDITMGNLKLVVDNGFFKDSTSEQIYLQAHLQAVLNMPTDVYGGSGSFIELEAAGTGIDSVGWATIPYSTWGGFGQHIQFASDTDAVILVVAWHTAYPGLRCLDTSFINIHIKPVPQDIWVKTNVPGSIHNMESLDFVDAKHGFGCQAFSPLFVKTSDGGLTWTSQNFPASKVDFITQDTGFAITNGIKRTFNGGSTFQGVPAPNNLENIFFQTTKIGFATTVFGEIYKTVDGSESWYKVAEGIGTKFAVDCPTPNVCYAVGENVFSSTFFMKSTDGGETWFAPQQPFTKPVYSLCAVGADTVFVAAWGGKIYRSFDGGITWKQPVELIESSNIGGLIRMINGQTGYSGSSNHLLKTNDYGETWSRIKQRPEVGFSASSFSFPAQGVGFYSAGYEAQYQGTNGGNIFRLVTGPYFELPPLCQGTEVQIDNKSSINGYQTFAWYRNGNFISADENPMISVVDTGYEALTLVAWKNNQPDTFSTNYNVKPKPPMRTFAQEPDFLCIGTNNIQLSHADSTTFSWEWKVVSEYLITDGTNINNFNLATTDAIVPDSAQIRVWGRNSDGCAGDTLFKNVAIGDGVLPYFKEDSLARVYELLELTICKPVDVDTLTLHYTFGYTGNQWAVKTWDITQPVANWQWEITDTTLTIHVDGSNNYENWKATLTAANPCSSHYLDVSITVQEEPAIFQTPADQTVELGTAITIPLALNLSGNDTVIYIVWFFDTPGGFSSIQTYEPTLTIPVFDALMEGKWFVEVFTNCGQVQSDTFLLTALSATHDYIHSESEPRLSISYDHEMKPTGNLSNATGLYFIGRLFDINGRVVWQESFSKVSDPVFQFPIMSRQAPPEGIYFLQVILGQETLSTMVKF